VPSATIELTARPVASAARQIVHAAPARARCSAEHPALAACVGKADRAIRRAAVEREACAAGAAQTGAGDCEQARGAASAQTRHTAGIRQSAGGSASGRRQASAPAATDLPSCRRRTAATGTATSAGAGRRRWRVSTRQEHGDGERSPRLQVISARRTRARWEHVAARLKDVLASGPVIRTCPEPCPISPSSMPISGAPSCTAAPTLPKPGRC